MKGGSMTKFERKIEGICQEWAKADAAERLGFGATAWADLAARILPQCRYRRGRREDMIEAARTLAELAMIRSRMVYR